MTEYHVFCVEDLESRKWKEVCPYTLKEREEVEEKFGSYCFLDSDNLKFPVCDKYTGCISCEGLKAARSRANLLYNKFKSKDVDKANHYKEIADRAELLADVFGCSWVR